MNAPNGRRWKSRALWALAAGATAAAATEARADGTVTANLSGGVLTITGDGSANQISVYPTAGVIFVEGTTGTVVSGTSQFPPASVNAVVVRMGGGDDHVNLYGFAVDSLDVDVGTGGGTVSAVDLSVSGAASVAGSDGSVFYAHTGGTLGGPLSFRASGAAGEMLLAALTLQGSLTADLTDCVGTTNRVGVMGATLLGKTTIRTPGAGTGCAVDVDNSSLTGALLIEGGDGEDNVRLVQSALAGKVVVKTGGGNDLIDADFGSSSRTPALLDGGAGDDTIYVNNTLARPFTGVKMKGGAGSDYLGIGNAYPNTSVDGGATMLGGSGDDTLEVDNTTANKMKIDGGGGNDNVSVDTTTVDSFVADGKGGTDTVSAVGGSGNAFGRAKVRGFEFGE